MKPLIEFTAFFREAAPYIHQYRGKTFVIGLTGDAFTHSRFTHIAQDIALLSSLGVQVVLVHGGHPQVEEALASANLSSIMNGVNRVVDKATLNVIKGVFGNMRFEIEAMLSRGLPNTPMAGASIKVVSGNFTTARPYGVLDGIDMQYSGKVRKIDDTSIAQYLNEGCIVQVSPVGYSLSGETFVLKMEEVASEIAIQLGAEKLLYLVKDKAILDADGNRVSTINAREAQKLLENTQSNAHNNNILMRAIKAVSSGVTRAHILCAHDEGVILNEVFTRLGIGTSIAAEPFVQIREATLSDIPAIVSIIRPLEEKGILLRRSREQLENNIQNFSVLENDTLIYACIALETYEDAPDMAELSCLAVVPYAQTDGYGQLMVEHIETKAKEKGITHLFLLTTQTAHWFIEKGFKQTTLDALPKSKQKQYNRERNSKIFIKSLV